MSNEDAALAHLKQRIEVASRERDRACQDEVQIIERQAAVAQRLASGSTQGKLSRQAGEDLRIRAAMFVQALGETWQSYRPGLDAVPPAQQMLLDTLRDASDARERGLRESASARTMGSLLAPVREQFRADAQQEVQQLDLKLREWALIQRQQPSAAPGPVQTTTVNFSGDHNVVNAGLTNSTVHIQIDAGSSRRLLDALATVRLVVETTNSLQPQDAHETLELVADAEHELGREQPNKRRLTASLQGIAATIQTVGALREAYGVFKSALAMVGIVVP